MLQNFLTKMYDYDLDSNKATPQPQGFTLQQVSDAFDAGESYGRDCEYISGYSPEYPNKKQHLATLTPAPDVKEVAVAFAEFIEFECYFDNDGWRCYKMDKDAISYSGFKIYDYWYENIYPGVIEQSKK